MPLHIPDGLKSLKDRLPFHKKKDELDEALNSVDDPNSEAVDPSEKDTNPDDDNGDMIMPEEKEDKATRVKKNLILYGLSALGIIVVGSVTYSLMTPLPKQQQDARLPSLNTASNANKTPAAELPDRYSDISKYTAKQNQANSNKPGPKTNAPVNPNISQRPSTSSSSNTTTRASTSTRSSTPVQSAAPVYQSSGVSSSPKVSQEEKKRQDEAQKAIESSIAFAISSQVGNAQNNDSASASDGSTPAAVTLSSADGYELPSYGGSYDLRAGSIIQATLLTGVTSDQPGGDVVAQVRQNVYDSQTGEHLLIPQGSKLIGKYGNAGARGNARIGIAFSRIILPTGNSIDLPDQKAIDGIGYPGLQDQYTEHRGKLFGATFMSAIIAAAAQSATGNTSGSDTRSPGQEAVSGAVADVLDSAKRIIDQQANVSPTVTIRPGFEFSIFINQDMAIPEYMDEY